jgi:hypothetical protein
MSTTTDTLKLEASYQSFVDFLRDDDLPATALSPDRFITALNMDFISLAQQAHVHRNTLSRAPASPAVQKFMRDVLRVVKAMYDVSGDVRKTLFWYRNEPLSVFEYKTPEMLVSMGRTDDVIRYVTSLEAGAAG